MRGNEICESGCYGKYLQSLPTDFEEEVYDFKGLDETEHFSIILTNRGEDTTKNSIQLEPDGKIEKCKEKVIMADYDKKILKLEAVEGDYIKEYKQCIATFEVIQKGEGNIFKITFEYEKQNPSVPVPHKYLDFFVSLVKKVDSKISLEKIVEEVEIKSDGEDILHMFGGERAHHAPNHGRGIVPELKLHHGKSGAVGSIKIWTFYADGKAEKCKEKVIMADYDKKIVKLEAVEGDYIKEYKQCIATYEVIKKGEGNIFKITFEYEKQNPSVGVPHKYMDFFVTLVKEVDSKIAHYNKLYLY